MPGAVWSDILPKGAECSSLLFILQAGERKLLQNVGQLVCDALGNCDDGRQGIFAYPAMQSRCSPAVQYSVDTFQSPAPIQPRTHTAPHPYSKNANLEFDIVVGSGLSLFGQTGRASQCLSQYHSADNLSYKGDTQFHTGCNLCTS